MLATFAGAESRKPNVIFILADDLGLHDLSAEGSTYYETPNIDRLAGEGMRFTSGYAACRVCSPSRASIMTGKFTARHGITDWIGAASGKNWNRNNKVLPSAYRHKLSAADTTIAEAFSNGGYRTFIAGKWHLGDGKESLPTKHGFDVNKGGYGAGSPRGGYFSPYRNPQLADRPGGESLPIRLATETADFMTENKSRPFFAYLSFYSVHGPIQTREKLWKKYRVKASRNPHEGDRFKIDRTLPVRQVQDCPIYAGMVETMDDAVGLVLDRIDELGLAENTIVVFTSDNGGVSSGDAYATSNLPQRGGKGRQWEGGIREPFYIKAPGTTKAGSTSAVAVTGTDFFPTLLELAGLPLLPKQHVDGVSLVPLMQGGKIKERPLFWHYPHYGNQGGEPSSMIRRGDWKLIHYYEDGGRDELYNLAQDPGEKEDVANGNADKVEKMRAELGAFLVKTQAEIPQADERFDPAKRKKQDAAIRKQRKPRLEKQHARYLKPGFRPNKDWWGSARD